MMKVIDKYLESDFISFILDNLKNNILDHLCYCILSAGLSMIYILMCWKSSSVGHKIDEDDEYDDNDNS